jgi:hypothetical protein
MWSGVLPSIDLASLPTATTLRVWLSTATTDGSLRTMPWPLTCTSVFAVPRSIATSLDSQLENDLNICSPAFECARHGNSTSRPRLEVSAFPEALPRSVSENYVIEQTDPDQVAAAHQPPRELHILRARCRDTGRMVVGDDKAAALAWIAGLSTSRGCTMEAESDPIDTVTTSIT